MERLNIWNGLDELAFYENTIILELLERSQGTSPVSIASSNRRRDCNEDCEKVSWVSDFVDDFALIAAGAGGASNVTAACLEREESPELCFTIRVAKNEPFKPREKQYLESIIMTMNKVKKGETHVETAQGDCLEAIMEHCRTRIRRYIVSLRELISEGQSNVIHQGAGPLYNPSVSHHESKEDIKRLGEYCTDTHSEYVKLSYERWTGITTLIHQIITTEDQQTVKSLANLAYQVRQSASFRAFLAIVYKRQQTRVTKMIERIGKISKFYRCALTIVRVAAKFCKDVSYICVKTLGFPKQAISLLSSRHPADLANRLPVAVRPKIQRENEKASRFLRRWRQYIVHAEMQLLLFYETHADIYLVQSYIGISKRSCYLCAAFIRLHGKFVIEGAHQQLYSLWTIPLQISFQSSSKENNFKKALSSLYDDVMAKVNAISVHNCYLFPFHMESVANFSRVSLLSSVTTTEAHDLGATASLTTTQPSFNVDGVSGEEEVPVIPDTLLLRGAPIERQRNAVFRKSIEHPLSEVCLSAPTALVEGVPTGNNEFLGASLSRGTEAAPKRSKRIFEKEIHSQENIQRRRRRRRRQSNAMGTSYASNRYYRQSNRRRAQDEERRRHYRKIQKGTRRSSKRDAHGIHGRLKDNGLRHNSMKTRIHSESDHDEISCIDVIGTCTKAVMNFFRGMFSGW